MITLGVFIGLTLLTFQSKVRPLFPAFLSTSQLTHLHLPPQYDFTGLGPWLFGGLIALVMTGFVGIFIPFSRTFDLVLAIGGTLLFSGYVVYDTHIITKRLSPDEYIMGAISLYLE